MNTILRNIVVIICIALNISCTLSANMPSMVPSMAPPGMSSIDQPPSIALPAEPESQQEPDFEGKTIHSISIVGNKLVTQEALLARIPFRVGDTFNPTKTGDAIRNLYNLRYFNTVSLEIEPVSETDIDLFIIVEEKKKVESIIYEGNKAIPEEEIEKELKLSEVPAMDEEEVELFAGQIKALYAKKNYHVTTIETELRSTERDTYIAVFKICDGPAAVVKRVCFVNECEFLTVINGSILGLK